MTQIQPNPRPNHANLPIPTLSVEATREFLRLLGMSPPGEPEPTRPTIVFHRGKTLRKSMAAEILEHLRSLPHGLLYNRHDGKMVKIRAGVDTVHDHGVTPAVMEAILEDLFRFEDEKGRQINCPTGVPARLLATEPDKLLAILPDAEGSKELLRSFPLLAAFDEVVAAKLTAQESWEFTMHTLYGLMDPHRPYSYRYWPASPEILSMRLNKLRAEIDRWLGYLLKPLGHRNNGNFWTVMRTLRPAAPPTRGTTAPPTRGTTAPPTQGPAPSPQGPAPSPQGATPPTGTGLTPTPPTQGPAAPTGGEGGEADDPTRPSPASPNTPKGSAASEGVPAGSAEPELEDINLFEETSANPPQPPSAGGPSS